MAPPPISSSDLIRNVVKEADVVSNISTDDELVLLERVDKSVRQEVVSILETIEGSSTKGAASRKNALAKIFTEWPNRHDILCFLDRHSPSSVEDKTSNNNKDIDKSSSQWVKLQLKGITWGRVVTVVSMAFRDEIETIAKSIKANANYDTVARGKTPSKIDGLKGQINQYRRLLRIADTVRFFAVQKDEQYGVKVSPAGCSEFLIGGGSVCHRLLAEVGTVILPLILFTLKFNDRSICENVETAYLKIMDFLFSKSSYVSILKEKLYDEAVSFILHRLRFRVDCGVPFPNFKENTNNLSSLEKSQKTANLNSPIAQLHALVLCSLICRRSKDLDGDVEGLLNTIVMILCDFRINEINTEVRLSLMTILNRLVADYGLDSANGVRDIGNRINPLVCDWIITHRQVATAAVIGLRNQALIFFLQQCRHRHLYGSVPKPIERAPLVALAAMREFLRPPLHYDVTGHSDVSMTSSDDASSGTSLINSVCARRLGMCMDVITVLGDASWIYTLIQGSKTNLTELLQTIPSWDGACGIIFSGPTFDSDVASRLHTILVAELWTQLADWPDQNALKCSEDVASFVDRPVKKQRLDNFVDDNCSDDRIVSYVGRIALQLDGLAKLCEEYALLSFPKDKVAAIADTMLKIVNCLASITRDVSDADTGVTVNFTQLKEEKEVDGVCSILLLLLQQGYRIAACLFVVCLAFHSNRIGGRNDKVYYWFEFLEALIDNFGSFIDCNSRNEDAENSVQMCEVSRCLISCLTVVLNCGNDAPVSVEAVLLKCLSKSVKLYSDASKHNSIPINDNKLNWRAIVNTATKLCSLRPKLSEATVDLIASLLEAGPRYLPKHYLFTHGEPEAMVWDCAPFRQCACSAAARRLIIALTRQKSPEPSSLPTTVTLSLHKSSVASIMISENVQDTSVINSHPRVYLLSWLFSCIDNAISSLKTTMMTSKAFLNTRDSVAALIGCGLPVAISGACHPIVTDYTVLVSCITNPDMNVESSFPYFVLDQVALDIERSFSNILESYDAIRAKEDFACWSIVDLNKMQDCLKAMPSTSKLTCPQSSSNLPLDVRRYLEQYLLENLFQQFSVIRKSVDASILKDNTFSSSATVAEVTDIWIRWRLILNILHSHRWSYTSLIKHSDGSKHISPKILIKRLIQCIKVLVTAEIIQVLRMDATLFNQINIHPPASSNGGSGSYPILYVADGGNICLAHLVYVASVLGMLLQSSPRVSPSNVPSYATRLCSLPVDIINDISSIMKDIVFAGRVLIARHLAYRGNCCVATHVGGSFNLRNENVRSERPGHVARRFVTPFEEDFENAIDDNEKEYETAPKSGIIFKPISINKSSTLDGPWTLLSARQCIDLNLSLLLSLFSIVGDRVIVHFFGDNMDNLDIVQDCMKICAYLKDLGTFGVKADRREACALLSPGARMECCRVLTCFTSLISGGKSPVLVGLQNMALLSKFLKNGDDFGQYTLLSAIRDSAIFLLKVRKSKSVSNSDINYSFSIDCLDNSDYSECITYIVIVLLKFYNISKFDSRKANRLSRYMFGCVLSDFYRLHDSVFYDTEDYEVDGVEIALSSIEINTLSDDCRQQLLRSALPGLLSDGYYRVRRVGSMIFPDILSDFRLNGTSANVVLDDVILKLPIYSQSIATAMQVGMSPAVFHDVPKEGLTVVKVKSRVPPSELNIQTFFGPSMVASSILALGKILCSCNGNLDYLEAQNELKGYVKRLTFEFDRSRIEHRSVYIEGNCVFLLLSYYWRMKNIYRSSHLLRNEAKSLLQSKEKDISRSATEVFLSCDAWDLWDLRHLVIKCLQQAANILGYRGMSDMINHNMPYVISLWLRDRAKDINEARERRISRHLILPRIWHRLEDFPCEVMGRLSCSSGGVIFSIDGERFLSDTKHYVDGIYRQSSGDSQLRIQDFVVLYQHDLVAQLVALRDLELLSEVVHLIYGNVHNVEYKVLLERILKKSLLQLSFHVMLIDSSKHEQSIILGKRAKEFLKQHNQPIQSDEWKAIEILNLACVEEFPSPLLVEDDSNIGSYACFTRYNVNTIWKSFSKICEKFCEMRSSSKSNTFESKRGDAAVGEWVSSQEGRVHVCFSYLMNMLNGRQRASHKLAVVELLYRFSNVVVKCGLVLKTIGIRSSIYSALVCVNSSFSRYVSSNPVCNLPLSHETMMAGVSLASDSCEEILFSQSCTIAGNSLSSSCVSVDVLDLGLSFCYNNTSSLSRSSPLLRFCSIATLASLCRGAFLFKAPLFAAHIGLVMDCLIPIAIEIGKERSVLSDEEKQFVRSLVLDESDTFQNLEIMYDADEVLLSLVRWFSGVCNEISNPELFSALLNVGPFPSPPVMTVTDSEWWDCCWEWLSGLEQLESVGDTRGGNRMAKPILDNLALLIRKVDGNAIFSMGSVALDRPVMECIGVAPLLGGLFSGEGLRGSQVGIVTLLAILLRQLNDDSDSLSAWHSILRNLDISSLEEVIDSDNLVIVRALRCFLHLCRRGYPRNIRVLAGSCIEIIGFLDPFRFDRLFARDLQLSNSALYFLSSCITKQLSRQSDDSNLVQLCGHALIVRALSFFLTNDSVHVMTCAGSLLLGTNPWPWEPAMRSNLVPPLVMDSLTPFQQIHCQDRKRIPKFLDRIFEDVSSTCVDTPERESWSDPWDPIGKSYSVWLTRLCSSLIRRQWLTGTNSCKRSLNTETVSNDPPATPLPSVDSVLAACETMCNLRLDFAEMIFPFILHDILYNDDPKSGFCRLQISDKIRRFIIIPAINLPTGGHSQRDNLTASHLESSFLKSVRLVIETLKFFRYIIMTERNLKAESASKSHTPSLRGSLLSRSAVKPANISRNSGVTSVDVSMHENSTSTPVSSRESGGNAAADWISCPDYFLNLDYLEVAVAAERCGAALTAVLYAEKWCEDQKGVISLRSCVSLTEDTKINTNLHVTSDNLLDLLRSIYSDNASDPDSLYGIAMSSSLKHHSELYYHEAQWSKLVSTYDSMLRQYTSSGLKSAPISMHTGILSGLQRLGQDSLSSCYARSLQTCNEYSSNNADQNAISELRYKAAWRLGQWDADINTASIDDAINYDNGDPSIQRDVFESLRALFELDKHSLQSGLSRIRMQVLDSIGDSVVETEGGSSLWRSIIRYQIAADIHDAREVRLAIENARVSLSQSSDANRSNDRLCSFEYYLKRLLQRWMSRLLLSGENENFCSLQDIYDVRCGVLEALRAAAVTMENRTDNKQRFHTYIIMLQDQLMLHQRRISNQARHCGQLATAQSAIFKYRSLFSGSKQTSSIVCHLLSLEESRVRRAGGESDGALLLSCGVVKDILDFHQQNRHGTGTKGLASVSLNQSLRDIDWNNVFASLDQASSCVLGEALCLTGQWLGEEHAAPPSTIVDLYFVRGVQLLARGFKRDGDATDVAVRLLTQSVGASDCAQAYFTLGRFVDEQYQSLLRHLDSPSWKTLETLDLGHQRLANETQEIIYKSKNSDAQLQQCKILLKNLNKTIKLHADEKKRIQDSQTLYLEAALVNYCKCLCVAKTIEGSFNESNFIYIQTSSEHYESRVVSRLCTLWFSNNESTEVNKLLEAPVGGINTTGSVSLDVIPSFKFLPLVYQIASRLGSRHLPFRRVLRSLICRMARDHPFHVIFQLFALINGKSPSAIDEDSKANEAFEIILELETVRKSAPNTDVTYWLRTLIADIRKLSEAYLNFADVRLDQKKRMINVEIPAALKSIQHLSHVPIPTYRLPIDKSGTLHAAMYRGSSGLNDEDDVAELGMGIPFLDRFGPYAVIPASGVSVPKKIECHGSDGKVYRQLLKGSDDVRQDAVMLQLFELVNGLFKEESDTRRRHLRLRTYRVIPLSPSAGVIEWVDGSMPLNEWLRVAHPKYHPGDWSLISCFSKMAENRKSTVPKDWLSLYHDICQHLNPVFHHYFTEQYLEPCEWFQKRLNYIRSAAAASIVGYVLGLGDRHLSNILIDEQSGELIHIDFGVTFEAGMLLQIPEQVPFRLTRDIEDGMGIAGVEGTFRRSCEATMRILRTNHELLMSILEVLVYDPLQKWTLPAKINERYENQIGDNNLQNVGAERTIMRLKQKLLGIESGETLSVEGQVRRLINEARDPSRLCLMFEGWHAFA